MREHLRARIAPRVPSTPQEEAYLEIVKVTWEAIRAYTPHQVFEGEIHLFRAPRPPTWFREDAVAGWRARTSRGIRLYDVFGDHVKLFSDPLSQRIIASVLERAQHGLVST